MSALVSSTLYLEFVDENLCTRIRKYSEFPTQISWSFVHDFVSISIGRGKLWWGAYRRWFAYSRTVWLMISIARNVEGINRHTKFSVAIQIGRLKFIVLWKTICICIRCGASDWCIPSSKLTCIVFWAPDWEHTTILEINSCSAVINFPASGPKCTWFVSIQTGAQILFDIISSQ